MTSWPQRYGPATTLTGAMSFFRRTRPDDLDRIRADIIRMNEAMNRQQRERADSSDPTAAINDLAARITSRPIRTTIPVMAAGT